MRRTGLYLALGLVIGAFAAMPEQSYGDTNSVFTVESNGLYVIKWTGAFRSDDLFLLTVVDGGKVLYHGLPENWGGFAARPLWEIILNVSLKILYASIGVSLLFYFARNLWRDYERSA